MLLFFYNFFLFNNSADIYNADIVITYINGVKIYQENNVSLKKNERKLFNLSYLKSNTYILYVISENYSEHKKIIVIN